jgi:hypothetical protein
MSTPLVQPKTYHITHVNNLSSIVADNYIEADGRRIRRGGDQTSIGMTEIKRRRLNEITVSCHPDTMVGDYVPFYFCPRSIMLYILYTGNHPDMAHYCDGQDPILHLQVDMEAAINWADQNRVRWTFSDRNAGSYSGCIGVFRERCGKRLLLITAVSFLISKSLKIKQA